MLRALRGMPFTFAAFKRFSAFDTNEVANVVTEVGFIITEVGFVVTGVSFVVTEVGFVEKMVNIVVFGVHQG